MASQLAFQQGGSDHGSSVEVLSMLPQVRYGLG